MKTKLHDHNKKTHILYRNTNDTLLETEMAKKMANVNEYVPKIIILLIILFSENWYEEVNLLSI